MTTKRGFGLTGILIAIVIILALGTAGVYVVKNTDILTQDVENDVNIIFTDDGGIKDVINQAEDVKNKLEESNEKISDNLDKKSELPTEALPTNVQEISSEDYSYYKIIGFEGGILEVTDPNSPVYGLKIEIPKGALFKNTTISARLINEPESEASLAEALFPQVDFGPEGTVFSVPIHITYLVKKETIQNLGANSLDDLSESLAAYYLDEATQTWEILKIVDIDSVNNTVTYKMDAFY